MPSTGTVAAQHRTNTGLMLDRHLRRRPNITIIVLWYGVWVGLVRKVFKIYSSDILLTFRPVIWEGGV